jgi:ubiquinol-cytochrome c reductase cytochrome c1 subunit
MKAHMKKLLLGLAFVPMLLASSLGLANETADLATAPIDPSDKASLQRGARTFINNCLNCHSANSMRYNRLQDIGLTEKQIKDNLVFAGEKVGETMKVSMNKADAKKWFGAAPPDLSVEVRARGADWVYAYLRSFYRDETRPTGWNNLMFDKVAMPHVLYELQGVQVLNHETHQLELVKPGKLDPAEYDAFAADLTNYMAFMAEPGKQQRKHVGIWALLFLGVLLVLTKKLKKEYWKDVK